jgi:hypothetical protein
MAKAPKGSALAIDALDKNALASKFGIAAAMYEQNPELMSVLQQVQDAAAAGKPIQDADVATMIQNTDWFRKHTNQWMQVQEARAQKDPSIWDATITNEAQKIKDTYVKAGAEIDDATARKYAEQMMYGSGWNADKFEIYDQNWLAKTIAKSIDFSKTKTINGQKFYDLNGAAQDAAENLYKVANDYGVDTSMSSPTFTSWFQKTLRGVMDGTVAGQDVKDEAQSMALSRFPGMAPQLQRGLSLREAADPYLTQMANVLEVDPGSLDMNDNLVQKVLNGVTPDGAFKPMSLYDAKLAARSDSRWQYTGQAKKEYTDMANGILRDFGFLG